MITIQDLIELIKNATPEELNQLAEALQLIPQPLPTTYSKGK